ncbi:MAG: FAD-dependent oxidoreductase [Candidatus Eisenbacteria bacterium]|nr:FAD-dependent oxidoreductase [Candidatus Eisenbacteria bacterium]
MKELSSITSLKQVPEVMSLQEAFQEAARCLLCYDAPCSRGCPSETDPGKFIRQIRFLNFKGGARTVIKNNILGGVCGLVCPTEKLCVKECSRTGIDIPIDIGGLQAFAVDYGKRMAVSLDEKPPQRKEKIAVIGSGPAGLSASYELARKGYQVTVFESEKEIGGTLRYGVPSFRCPEVTFLKDISVLEKLGVRFKTRSQVKGPNQAAKLLKSGFKAVFIGVGLQTPYAVSVPGINLKAIATAKDFLKSVRAEGARGAAGKLVRDKNVAIIGGGSVAMDVAATCRALKANRVYAISLESLKELPACKDDIELARMNHLIFKPQCQVTEIIGGKSGKVTGVKGVETEWIKPNNFLPSNVRQVPGTSFTLKVGAVIQAIGLGPSEKNAEIYSSLKKKGKYIAVNEKTMQTSVKGVFAGGDIIRGGLTVVQAVADGKRAAAAIDTCIRAQGRARI